MRLTAASPARGMRGRRPPVLDGPRADAAPLLAAGSAGAVVAAESPTPSSTIESLKPEHRGTKRNTEPSGLVKYLMGVP